MQSSAHYSTLKAQKESIKAQFDDNLGVLRWEDNGKRIGFLRDSVEHVSQANRDEEFSWLHDKACQIIRSIPTSCLGIVGQIFGLNKRWQYIGKEKNYIIYSTITNGDIRF